MKESRQLGMLAVVIALGAGCTQKSAPTVEYYRGHADERQAQLSKCANDPGSLKDSAPCVNALQAAELERVDSLRALPPMGLSHEEGKAESPKPANPDGDQ